MTSTGSPAPPVRSSSWPAVIGLYAGLTLLYAWPLLPAMASRLPSDTGDPGLNTWILWWNAQAIPLTERWWNAPIFFPVHGAFALSETMLALTPLTTPLQWMGASPVLAYNVAFLLSYFSAALAAHGLAHALTGRHGAAFIAGIGFGFSPYRAAQLPHLQTLMSCWLPLGLLALHRFLATRRRRYLVLLAACWILNGLTTGYFLFFFSALVGCWTLWFVRTWRDAAAVGAALAIASLVLAPVLIGYNAHQSAFGMSRGLGEIVFYSADVSAIWAVSPFVWLPKHWTLAPRPEGELYPGAVILALVAIGVWSAWRHRSPRVSIVESQGRRRVRLGLLAAGTLVATIALISAFGGGWQLSIAGVSLSTNHPYKTVSTAVWLWSAAALLHPRLADGWRRRSVFLFYVLAALLMFVLALGPLARVFDARFLYQAPYAWLMELPGGHALRVPARFAMLVILCLTQAAALAFARIPVKGGRANALFVAAIALAVALDGWVPKLKTDPLPPMIDLSGLDAQLPVLELPITDIYSETTAMLRAAAHHHPLVNGFSGYTPPHYAALQQGTQDLDPDTFAAVEELGPLVVFTNRTGDPGGRYRDFVGRLPGATLVRETALGTVYTLTGRAPTRRPAPPDGELTIQSIDVSGGHGPSAFLNDRNLDTAWRSREPAGSDATVRLAFNRPAEISRLELDAGHTADEYPRRVHVSVRETDDAAERTVWDGPLTGLALRAALRDNRRMPLTMDLPDGTRAQQIIVTIRGGDPKAVWRIAEIRAFGR